MKIRMEGTEADIAAAIERFGPVLEIQEVSRFYANRGASTLCRVYLTVAAPAAPPVLHSEAERADQPRRLRNGKEIR
jgi:hypothetical protein